MNTLSLQRTLNRRTRELTIWQVGTIGLLTMSALMNAAFASAVLDYRQQLTDQSIKLQQAEHARDYAIEQLGAAALQAEQDKQDRAAFARACEAAGSYQYVGECAITAYCPCVKCCGTYADGLTASGIPAGPGIVAVDPDVIPLGSAVVIDGQRFLAADTGVSGYHVDLCLSSHEAAESFGVRTESVWVEVLS